MMKFQKLAPVIAFAMLLTGCAQQQTQTQAPSQTSAGPAWVQYPVVNATEQTGSTQAKTAAAPSKKPAPAPAPKPENISASISNFSFSPSAITVKAGSTVTWTNNDPFGHTVTSDSGTFDSGNIPQGQSFSFTFKTPGTYTYHCAVHPMMKGSVIVD